MIDQMLGQYRITAKLGEGGMGAVYKGVDTMIDREVAIKILRPEIAREPILLQRFRAEAVTVAKLNHAGIATLYNFVQHDDNFFMVMEYVPGKTLEEVERERGALPWQTAVPLFQKILDAVQPAHDAGILHRDIKPANIMLTTWGAIKVMDFGIARMLGSSRMTREGSMVGTIEYIPPERVKGEESDARGDIYSLGVVLFEMLGGRLPFQSESEYELMRCHLQEPLPTFHDLHAEVPQPIENVVRRATAKCPEERFSSCDEFSQALQAAAGHVTIGKKGIIDLVGALTVEQLGTAGHTTPSGGSVAPPSRAPERGDRIPWRPLVPPTSTSAVSSIETLSAKRNNLMSYLRTHWQLVALIAVILSIGAGLLIGMATRQSSPPLNAIAPDRQPSAPPSVSPSATAATVSLPTTPRAPTPQEQPVSSAEPIGQPIVLAPTSEERKPAPAKKQKDLHSEALKALNQ